MTDLPRLGTLYPYTQGRPTLEGFDLAQLEGQWAIVMMANGSYALIKCGLVKTFTVEAQLIFMTAEGLDETVVRGEQSEWEGNAMLGEVPRHLWTGLLLRWVVGDEIREIRLAAEPLPAPASV